MEGSISNNSLDFVTDVAIILYKRFKSYKNVHPNETGETTKMKKKVTLLFAGIIIISVLNGVFFVERCCAIQNDSLDLR